MTHAQLEIISRAIMEDAGLIAKPSWRETVVIALIFWGVVGMFLMAIGGWQ